MEDEMKIGAFGNLDIFLFSGKYYNAADYHPHVKALVTAEMFLRSNSFLHCFPVPRISPTKKILTYEPTNHSGGQNYLWRISPCHVHYDWPHSDSENLPIL